ncbi:MAG: arylsulfotransferase family protein [Pseudoxanthomonas sp.]
MAISEHPRRAGRFRALFEHLPKVAFGLSLLMLAFGYGVATIKYRLFPYPLLTRAQQAYTALHKVEDTTRPPHFLRFLEPGETGRILKPATSALLDQTDLILMSGSFFHRTDICPKIGCLAWIMRRDGTVLHRWSVDPAKLFNTADFKGFSGFPGVENIMVWGLDLDREGNLVIIFQARNAFPDAFGIVKLAPDGRLLWKRIDHSHHWPTVGPDGRIYTPISRIIPRPKTAGGLPYPNNCQGDTIDDQGVRVLAPDGAVLHEFWFTDIARQSGLRVLEYLVRGDCDPFHANGIDLVNDPMAAKLRAMGVADAKPGDLIVSLRSSSSVVIMDSETGRIKHVVHGPMIEQHSPATLPDGSLLIFDNVGASTGNDLRSRVLRISLAPERNEQVFPRAGIDDPHLYSKREGQVNVSPDGKRVLVSEGEGGRLFEVELTTGKVLWAYREVADIAAYEARVGAKPSGRLALMHVQGASYVSQADYARMFGGT